MEQTIEKIKEYKLFEDKCPHCSALVCMDYEIVPHVRTYKFPCPKCGKTLQVKKVRTKHDLEGDESTSEESNGSRPT